MAVILDFLSELFSYFYLQVTPILPTKFRVDWSFRSGEIQIQKWIENFMMAAVAVVVNFQ